MYRVGKLIGILMVLMIGVMGVSGQEASIELDADTPVVEHGESGTWDGQYTDPGGVIFHDGQFHLFRNGFVGWPAWAGTAYLTSPDGFNWEPHGTDPVISTDDVPFAETGALVTSVLVEADGTWTTYFYTVGEPSSPPESWAIGRATASDPAGPWTVDAEPVLLPGGTEEWDSGIVTTPSVVKTDDGYVMYYAGNIPQSTILTLRIGMATSADGIKWTKYDDPATTDAPFAESDPVLMPGAENEWDDTFVHQPRVVITPEGWVMSYRSAQQGGANNGYGFATSQDGIHWERYSNNPYLLNTDIRGRPVYFNSLVYRDDQYYVFIEIQRATRAETDIYTAIVDVDLFQ